MKRKQNHFAVLALLCAAGALVLPASAGPLSPPLGPVSSTGKTIAEVEPRIAINSVNTPSDGTSQFVISQPGSYYLTGNFEIGTGLNGILIASSNVTIDLNGFTFSATNGGAIGMWLASEGLENLNVRNGVVSGWSLYGIIFNAAGVKSGHISDVVASENGSDGISVYERFTLDRCTAIRNGGAGITTGAGCFLNNCNATQNQGNGIHAGGNSVLNSCISDGNTGDGFNLTNIVTISHCTATGNTANGFSGLVGCQFLECLANTNGGCGVLANADCTISSCHTRFSGVNGISVSTNNLVAGNTCVGDGGSTGACIRVDNIRNRIERNDCASAHEGIHVFASANFITCNTCSSNTTNWIIAVNNVYGPIIDRRLPSSAAVNGNSAASSTGSTDPTANYTY